MKEALVMAAVSERLASLCSELKVLGYEAHGVLFSEWTGLPAGVRPDVCVVDLSRWPEEGFRILAQMRRDPYGRQIPVLVVMGEDLLLDLVHRESLFDDFALAPVGLAELDARLRHILWKVRRISGGEVVRAGDLVINLGTYQVYVKDRPVDLTYMEYELLRFLATHPGRVFSREMLLSRVWGYDYFGGSRTVDVHVRRLRAKLGECAGVIETVRGVGYRFSGSAAASRKEAGEPVEAEIPFPEAPSGPRGRVSGEPPHPGG